MSEYHNGTGTVVALLTARLLYIYEKYVFLMTHRNDS